MPLDRRSLLLAAGAALTAPALARTKPSSPPTWKRAIKLGMIGEGKNLRERFLIAKEVGFDGVELDSPSTLDHEEILRAREEAGLEIPGVIGTFDLKRSLADEDPARRARVVRGIETALRDCSAFGASVLQLHPGVVDEARPYHLVYERSLAGLKPLLPLAEELGVKIAFQNAWTNFLLSPLEAARYCDELESENVGWYLNVGNVVRYGWPEHWVQALGARILRIELKEYSRKKQVDEGIWKGFQVELGEGDCGWPRVMAALAEVGYEGWAGVEVRGGTRERLREVLGQMDRILAS